MILGIDASNIRSGGGVTHLSELLRAAEPNEHGIVRVIVWGGRCTLEHLPNRHWLDLVNEPVLDGPLPKRFYWQQRKLAQLATGNCDLLFIPGGTYTGTFRPFVTVSQNLLPFEGAEMRRFGVSWTLLRLVWLRLSQTRSFHNADGVIFLTEHARSTVMKQTKAFKSRWVIIPHGIDKRFRLPPRAQKPLDAYSHDKPFRLLYVSIVSVYKHQWHVAKAVAKLRQAGVPLMLDLIGPAYPPALRRLRKIIMQVDPNEKCIHYRGFVPYSELTPWYHQADGFVFASSCENMPNILLEAMASGLPIACSNRSAMPEILGDAGVYFDPERPVEIASTLGSLIENPVLREHCAWAAFQCAQAYSWERCARETFSFLAKVAQGAGGKRE